MVVVIKPAQFKSARLDSIPMFESGRSPGIRLFASARHHLQSIIQIDWLAFLVALLIDVGDFDCCR